VFCFLGTILSKNFKIPDGSSWHDCCAGRHGHVLQAHWLSILSCLPEVSSVADFEKLLPGCTLNAQPPSVVFPPQTPWRGELDWAEQPNAALSLEVSVASTVTNWQDLAPALAQHATVDDGSWLASELESINAQRVVIFNSTSVADLQAWLDLLENSVRL
jgi:hypothetical protein